MAIFSRSKVAAFTQAWLSRRARFAQIDAMFAILRRLAPPLATAAMLAVLPAPLIAREPPPPGTVDIWNDSGGNVIQMVQRRSELQQSGKQVRIRGYCRSACTMLITMPNACLGPRAKVGFHAPRIPNTTIIPPMVDQIMGNYYRNGIRERWFAGWSRQIDMTVITAEDYVLLDPQTRLCSGIGGR